MGVMIRGHADSCMNYVVCLLVHLLTPMSSDDAALAATHLRQVRHLTQVNTCPLPYPDLNY
eukprot:5012085-Amphidinium_carterae.3